MSRIGKCPIQIPPRVKVAVKGNGIIVEGPLGKNEKIFDDSTVIEIVDDAIQVACRDIDDEHSRVMQGTVRSIINSMVIGVISGYSKNLEISGIGFKAVKGSNGKLSLDLGYSHDIIYSVPSGVDINIDPSGTKIEVKGIDKKMVGQVAADIKSFYPVEPYKGKGVKIIGQFVRRKEGKKTA